MEKNRGTVIAVIAALVVSVISLGVAFAAFSAQLTINGNATIQASTWDIHFSTTSGGSAADDATITPESANLGTATSVSALLNADNFTWSGTFKSPGDTLEYHFFVVNNGDYNAKLSGTYTSTLTCTGVTSHETYTCPIEYTVKRVNSGSLADFADNLQLAHDSSIEVVVKAKLSDNYGTDGSTLFGEAVTVDTTQVVFTWTQDGTAQ